MTAVFMVDPGTGKVALFDEAPGGGAPDDPAAVRNRPLLDPQNWLANLYFHSDLDNLEVAFDRAVPITHAAVAGSSSDGVSGGGGVGSVDSGVAEVLRFDASSAENTLLTHGLGYVPDFMVVVGGKVLFPGMPVQTLSGGRGRYASAYATSTQIKLHEWTSVSASGLSSTTLSYRVIVFRAPPAPSGNLLFDFNPASGEVQMGLGRFSSLRSYLQVVAGGSPFGIAYGKAMDLRNGAPRIFYPDGTKFEPVPSTQKGRFVVSYGSGPWTYTGAYGSSMAYNGSATAPEQILVQAP